MVSSTSSNAEILHLTDASFDQASFVLFTQPIPAEQGFSIEFDFYAYGGNGADGISFFLIDGATSPTKSGGLGGSLGYAPRIVDGSFNEPGLVGGYLGIGLDEFGNFSLQDQGREGGTGFQQDAIAVRGSAAKNYAYLTGTPTLPVSLDNPGSTATRENSRRHARIDLSPTGLLSVQVDLNGDGDSFDPGENAISSFDVPSVNGALPSSFKFGFAASTGELTNIHEVGRPLVLTFAREQIPGSGDDTLIRGNDNNTVLVGNTGDDILISGPKGDTLTGGAGADRFVFSGPTKKAALRTSTLVRLDRITDFRGAEGDRIQLDFDDNLVTIEKPKRLSQAGQISAKNLIEAAQTAYADCNSKKSGRQALKINEAVFFDYRNHTYLSVNDSRKASFSVRNDLLVDVKGIQFHTQPNAGGTFKINSYFA